MPRVQPVTRASATALALVALFQLGLLRAPARAGEVNLEEDIQTIDGVQIFKAEGKENEYYYLPTDIHFAIDDKNEPAFFLLKFNLPTDQAYVVSDAEGNKKMAKQGGILAIEVSYTLSDEKFKAIEKKIKEKNPNATLALMPIDEASISLEYIDPATQQVKVKTAPETAPLSGNSFPFLVALSKEATDIMWDAFSKPASTAILNAKMGFKYTGYIAPLKVTVQGKWENVFNHTSWNLNASGGAWLFRARADIQSVFEKMQQDGTLVVKWKGGASPDAQKLVDRLTDAIVPAMFDTNFGPPPDPAKAQPAGGFFGGVSFAYKQVEKRRKGNFFFDYERKEKVSRSDARGSRFSDIDALTKKDSLERHFRIVKPGDWGIVAPRIYVNADLQKYAKVAVNVRYAKSNPATAVFSSETGLKNIVPREWSPDKNLPEDKQYEYEYSIEAELKDGSFPKNVVPKTKFNTKDWLKSDKPFLIVSPEDWGGPEQVRLTVGPLDGFEDRKVKRATITVTWNDGGMEPTSETFKFKTGEEKYVWEAFLIFPKDKPRYTAVVEYIDKDNNNFGPFEVKQGSPGASASKIELDFVKLKRN